MYLLGSIFRECLGEAHEPCDCETWKNWLQKISEMKPEERKNVHYNHFGFLCSKYIIM